MSEPSRQNVELQAKYTVIAVYQYSEALHIAVEGRCTDYLEQELLGLISHTPRALGHRWRSNFQSSAERNG